MRDQWRRSDEPHRKNTKKFKKQKFDRYQELEGEVFSQKDRLKHRNRREPKNTLQLLELAEVNE